jgi:periplasmic divalent cation tolerance protein
MRGKSAMTGNIWSIYSTFPSKTEALSVAQELVAKRLIACANVLEPVISVYRWQGAVQQQSEVALIAKTQQKHLAAAIEKIKSLHSYDVPCVVASPIEAGHAPFLQWVEDET